MELEEAIKILKSYENKLVYEISEKDKEAVAVVLNQLDSLKLKYQARKDRTDTIIKKQEKMIELMAEHISFGEDIQKILCSPKVHKEGACTCITCKRCIKQYFEKKAEESE